MTVSINEESGSCKYRLVEAEEVDSTPVKPTSFPNRRNNKKGKGGAHWHEMPSKEKENDQEDPVESGERGGKGRGGRGNWNKNGRGGRRVYQNNKTRGFYNGVYIVNNIEVTAEQAKKQIEFYFSTDNLARDTFLRRHMDVEGYVPVALVASFNSVFAYHQDYPSLLNALNTSDILELDLKNEKIRPRSGWKQWLWPNGAGGYGVPLYVKITEGSENFNKIENRNEKDKENVEP